MKNFAILALYLLSLSVIRCYAEIPKSLVNGTANYQEVLQWSKEKIIQEAKSEFTNQEIQSSLDHFPVLINNHCDNLTILFIENTPQCGTINCKHLVFTATTSPTKQLKYRYINEISFSANKLFCYGDNNRHNYYLVTSEHETNATGLINLYQFVKNKFVHKAQIKVDYTKVKKSEFADSIWENNIKESDLLKGFKIR